MKAEHEYIIRVLRRFIGLQTRKEKKEEIMNLDWSEVLYQSTLHHVNTILFLDLKETNNIIYINNSIYKLIKNSFDCSRTISRLMGVNAAKLINLAESNNIDAIIVKGIILENILYNINGAREFNDIDLIINKKNLSKFKNLLEKEGFAQGKFQKETDVVLPVARRDIIEKELYSHETIEFFKQEDTRVIVDLNFELMWKNIYNLLGVNLKVDFFMENKETYIINESKVVGPSLELLFIHTCIHLYCEAVQFCWQYSWYKNYGDLELRKYLDIALFFNCDIDWNYISEIIKKFNLVLPIRFTLTHLLQIFPDLIVPDIMQDYIGIVEDEDYFYTCKNEKMNWLTPFKDRIFNQVKTKDEVFSRIEEKDIQVKK